MTGLDWAVVVLLNLSVFTIAGLSARRTRTEGDWFLGGRALPFWLAGLSMFATSLDAAEQISVSGHTYNDGIKILSHYWLGLPIAYAIGAFFVLPRMYRSGMFTNAEYLEARFGAFPRIVSVIVQLQYRANILGSMSIALHLLFVEVVDMPSWQAWCLVVGLALLTTLYTAFGGLKTVATTDLLLGIIMILGTILLWVFLLQAAGGWNSAVTTLESQGRGYLVHIGDQRPGQPWPAVTIAQWVIIAVGFVVVNHTQTMKMLGTRSLWDLKMCVLVAVAVGSPVIFMNSTFSLLGQTLLPDALRPSIEAQPDRILPALIDLVLGPGLKGLVVAGVIAAAVSTYEGIGSALGALLTRDLYARWIVRDASEKHYVHVGRVAVFVVVAVSFLYVPFILRYASMMTFFLRITNVFVTPLMTVYLVGSFTRANRKTALVGLAVGPLYGILSLLGDIYGFLPFFLSNAAWTYIWSVLLTSSAMLLASMLLGWEGPDIHSRTATATGWLGRSQEKVRESLSAGPLQVERTGFWSSPILWTSLTIAVSCLLVFYWFW